MNPNSSDEEIRAEVSKALDKADEGVKVYAVNLNDKDYSGAEEYGDIIYMTEGVLDLRKAHTYEQKIRNFLKNSTEEDYLLLSGPTLICCLAINVWLDNHKQCKVLYWSNGKYQEYLV